MNPTIEERECRRGRGHVLLLLLAAGCVLGLAPVAVHAQATAIAIQRNADLSFGQLVAASAGTVTVTPEGTRSASGVLLGNSSTVSAASFTVSGEPNTAYAVTLPGSITLSNGGQTMTVRSFTSTPDGVGTLGTDGSQMLTVGATLEVQAGQAAGAYSGSFSVRVDYN